MWNVVTWLRRGKDFAVRESDGSKAAGLPQEVATVYPSNLSADIRMCKDVSNVGRWGNGDVEVGLSSLDQLPYVMGLVRQSFEWQMEGGGSA